MIETTLSGKYLVKYINRAKENGFQVILIYLFLENPYTNITRVMSRVIGGGHHVPKEDIIRRFYRSKNMFFYVYKDLVDEWEIYYNSNENFEKIADKMAIYDQNKMNEFKRISNENQ